MLYICLLAGAISYLIGSINTSVLVSAFFGKDVRKEGSGNAGATNTLRVFGKGAAAVVILGDALKGVIAILITNFLVDFFRIIGDPVVPISVSALCVVLGHNFPIYFGFKGGKGITTSAAVIFMIDWQIGLIVLVVALTVMAISKYVSLGSCCGAIVFPAAVIMFYENTTLIILSFAMAALALYMHRKNIQRLINGTESKLSLKGKQR